MNRLSSFVAVAAAGSFVLACGDNVRQGECGAGTVLEEASGRCIAGDGQAPTTTATPAGGRYQTLPGVLLATDEPATIFYTVDGSEPTTSSPSGESPVAVNPQDGVEVRFFAVDTAGNTETARAELYNRDIDAPGPVENLAAALADNDVTVSWQAPSTGDFAGVLLVRAAGFPVVGGPVAGDSYSAGDQLPGGHEVLFVGTEEEYDDADIPVGVTGYTAWAFDDLGNYGPLRSTTANLLLPGQTGTIVVDVDTLGVTVNDPPANTGLSGTATFETGTLTVSVEVENQANRIIFNPRMSITDVTGTTGVVTTETFETTNYVDWGPLGMKPGEARTRDIVVTGVSAGETVSIDVEFTNAPMAIGTDWTSTDEDQLNLFNLATGQFAGSVKSPDLVEGGNGEYVRFAGGYMTPDASTTYLVSRHRPFVVAFDTATMSSAKLALVTGTSGVGYGGELRATPDGQTLYAVMVNNQHIDSGNHVDGTEVEIHLVRFDAATLMETGRVTLENPAGSTDDRRGRWLAISPDFTRAAMTAFEAADDTRDEARLASVHLINLTSMEEIDLDGARAGTNGIDLTDDIDARQLTFSPDGATLYIGGTNQMPNRLVSVDIATRAVTPVDITPVLTGGTEEIKGFAWDGNTLVFGADNGIYTLSNGTVELLSANDSEKSRGLRIVGDKIYSATSSEIRVIDVESGDIDMRLPGTSTMYNHYFPVTPF